MRKYSHFRTNWIWCGLLAIAFLCCRNLHAQTPITSDPGFYYTYWQYHTVFNINTTAGHSTISHEVDEFPIAIRLGIDNTDILNNISDQGQGTDIRFTTNDYKEIPYQIEKIDHTEGGRTVIWVRVPKILPNNSTQNIIMHYGFKDPTGQYTKASDADQYSVAYWRTDREAGASSSPIYMGVVTDQEGNPEYTFSDDQNGNNAFLAVWHGNSIPGLGGWVDASPNEQDVFSTEYSGMDASQGSMGDEFNINNNPYGTVHDGGILLSNMNFQSQITLSCWLGPILPSGSSCGWPTIARTGIFLGNNDVVFWLYQDGCGTWIEAAYEGTDGDQNLVDLWWDQSRAWYVPNGLIHVAVVIDPSNADERFYINGNLFDAGRCSTYDPINWENGNVRLFKGDGGYFSSYVGDADEIRIEGVARSDDWIKLCYDNQRGDQSLVSVSPEYSPNMCGSGQSMAVDGYADFKSDAGVAGVLTVGFSNSSVQDNKLLVNGRVKCDGIQIRNWLFSQKITTPDYVFSPDYKLPELRSIESYIKNNHHLPDMPSASEMKENGVELTKLNMLFLKKIEELTLYTIKLENKLNEAERELGVLKKKIK